jgi:hypothetical protein
LALAKIIIGSQGGGTQMELDISSLAVGTSMAIGYAWPEVA